MEGKVQEQCTLVGRAPEGLGRSSTCQLSALTSGEAVALLHSLFQSAQVFRWQYLQTKQQKSYTQQAYSSPSNLCVLYSENTLFTLATALTHM